MKIYSQTKEGLLTAEKDGNVADNLETRKQLLQKVEEGKLTLHEAQKQLKVLQKNAHSCGLYTRDDILSGRIIDWDNVRLKRNMQLEKKLNAQLKLTTQSSKKSKI